MPSPAALLNRSINASTAATWIATLLQILLAIGCRKDDACAGGRPFFVWLLLPQAVFTVLVLRSRGVSWRFTQSTRTPLPTLELDSSIGGSIGDSKLTLPMGVLSTLLSGALAAEALHGLASPAVAAKLAFLAVSVLAATAVAANCLILHTWPQLEAADRSYAAVLSPLD